MKRAKQNLSHHHLTTFDMGELIPVGCVEVLPNDTVRHHTNVLIRVSPLASPVMHPVRARIHHFFVPSRLVWNKMTYTGNTNDDDGNGSFEDFITGGPDGNNNAKPPQTTTTPGNRTLQDHMGLPRVSGVQINSMPLRCYNLIFNEYYRDQDLSTKADLDAGLIQRICWEKDYFTSARPWTQKGDDVTLPLGDKAPVTGLAKETNLYDQTINAGYEAGGNFADYASSQIVNSGASANKGVFHFEEDPDNPGHPNLYADLSQATGLTINEVRTAFALQRYKEARSRYGSRYTEYLRYLGVRNPADSRLDRPEFLGGGTTPLTFSEILQTASVVDEGRTDFGVGDLYGHGIAAMRSNAYQRYIEEHGYIMSMLSIRPHAMYQDGVKRKWLRETKEDWFQRELQHVGQQEIYNNEIYADPSPTGREVFGYQDRYNEYREEHSYVSGEYRDTLDYWHMARKFPIAPALNDNFVRCDATKRIHNVQGTAGLWVMTQHQMVARRMLARQMSPRVF